MRLLTLILIPAALLASQSRFARLGEFQGQVEVQLTAADPWIPAERNLPLLESAWLRTGSGARVEIEMDDGSAWRLGPDSLGEISDYTRLSTGQRITLLSLDHGTAYYTGQPAAKDVTMLVMPGAQLTVLQGSRVRQVAQPGSSEVAVLEGVVRFSSPTAELDIREGTTARVDPANSARFALDPQIAVEALDNWSESRDKMEAAPASAAYVNASYGLADLDAKGEWTPSEKLGTVWKPEVADGWAPYQNGRWRYYESLGYTWVSDDPWGWVPYHNGRWARDEKLGWVWQPAANPVFHPGDVYWLRGSGFAGWGPLAPGEQWNAPNPGSVTPLGYMAGATGYAGFRPDSRTVDGAGFAQPTADQMKTAFFVPALPSPAFLTARLDAVRPTLQVGVTRVMPSVPGVAFGDTQQAEPPSDLMTNPPADVAAPPPDSDTGVAPPPDGVYPVQPVVIPVIDTTVVINPSGGGHPTYAPPRPAGSISGGGAAPTQSNNPPSTSGGNKPTHPTDPPPAGKPPSQPVNHPVSVPVHPNPLPPSKPTPPAPPKVDDTVSKKVAAASSGERDFYRRVLQDIDPKKPDFAKALKDLDAWSREFPGSSFENDRRYYYIHVYNGMARFQQVLDTAAPLVDAGVRGSYRDQQQILQILVAASAAVVKVRNPTPDERAIGQKAALELLEFLPDYFAPQHKPASVSDSTWTAARVQLEGYARQALGLPSVTRLAAAN